MAPIRPDMLVEHLMEIVPDGACVAIGGNGLIRKPMALVRALVATGRRGLRIVVFLGSVDVEVLLGSDGVEVAEVHTAGVSLDAFGLAPRYRAARESADSPVVPWSEGSLHAALEASARGLPSMPTVTSPEASIVAVNPWLRVVNDPFDGVPIVQVRAMPIDLALIHGYAIGPDGDIHVNGDLGIDDVLVRAADRVLASVETSRADLPRKSAAFSRVWIDDVVELPGGSWPTGVLPDVAQDDDTIARYAASKGSDLDALVGGGIDGKS